MPTVREFLGTLGDAERVQSDAFLLDLLVVSTQFPSAEEQDAGVFLVIRTEQGLFHLRMEETLQKEWLTTLSRNLRYGGTRNEHIQHHGSCPARKLKLIRP